MNMVVGDSFISPICDKIMNNGNGFNLLKKGLNDSVLYNNGTSPVKTNYWDAVGALCGYLNGMTYIRFRNGDDPNRRDIRSCPSANAITLKDKTSLP